LLGSDGALLEAKRLYEANPNRYFKGDQCNNPSNWRAHYETTGVEIFYQSRGKVTHFVAGVGTGGTPRERGRASGGSFFWSSPVGLTKISRIDREWRGCDDPPGWRRPVFQQSLHGLC